MNRTKVWKEEGTRITKGEAFEFNVRKYKHVEEVG